MLIKLQLLSLAVLLSAILTAAETSYKVGVGRADCTGPAAEITFMGYAKANQKGCGIHLRQFSRAFIFNDGKNLMTFVTVDACMMNHPLKQAVIDKLEALIPKTFTLQNTIISGSHTHSTPGGWLKDVMYDFPNLGFVQESFDALVDGIVRSIEKAYKNQVDAQLYMNSGILLDSNINRSPAAYAYNPTTEQNKYEYNVDKDLVQLKIVRAKDDVPIGVINWFAVHPTSMNNTNCLIHSDNVGYASILLESSMEPDSLPGKTSFVGAFASTNLGDTSPNLKDPICIDTGKPCDYTHSTCDGKNEFCIAFGPGNDMVESTEIIATNLFKKGKELLESANSTEISGELRFIHRFIHMPSQTATYTLSNGTTINVHGCRAAMGYGFAAGTTDGPGEFDFTQATTTSNAFWNIVRDFIFPPTKEDAECHAPKPILIMSGAIQVPYEWQPSTVSIQMFQIGQFFVTAVPGEFTTMSGRRLREAVANEITSNGGPNNPKVVIAGLSNVYTNYIATPEEYQLQRYEGASTIYGPYTLPIYIQRYKELAKALISNTPITDDSEPYKFPNNLMSLVPPVIFDASGWWNNYGDCIVQPKESYTIGDIASATFVAGHPRNDNMQEKTFLNIEMQQKDATWKVVATDADWETKFIWKRQETFKPISQAEIQWKITKKVNPGTYRITHFGNYKYIFGGIYPYSGTSNSFTVST
ncbi:neutral ceramidase [Diorhabda carinulata]|uniref:neutral ceramidase n=1 Tax=Diorhabda carinulata TaxID=1163345 RepID=UPI0025A04276|nr:neutral ceramidase [Diorhabda carinulata]XP_057661284.1 neutral ceramidase [Diorhabda carinulata]XP_057661285.1 neutral ceramidase [Diorhabda carinulata]XP_057661286.1 neutral ceramidase [Diorhabda carinulata]XP_057661288.1 neutral ceramidase [Diorhabda carinulata]XP_057661289.1 neutral ceramidase [Diorhabda carinulata]XP_057661290.1 neutral ceramidase [Diorhabda carinulata]XP_057661291.1 neutral ceramidase [Diorhabda carinulata]